MRHKGREVVYVERGDSSAKWLFWGAVLGAGLALMYAPRSGEETRRVMEALSQAIVNKVLHAPMVKLKDSSRAGHGRHWTEMISELFGLRAPGRSGPPE